MQTRTVIAAAALAVLAACGGGGGGGGGGVPLALGPAPAKKEPKEQPIKPPPVCTVWLEGDSILNGSSLQGRVAEPPAAGIKRLRPMYAVTDRSVPGNSVQQRSPGFLAEQFAGARFVVVQFGINDGGNGFDYREPLRSLVQRVKGLGKTPIVTGLSRVRGAPAWRDTYDHLAHQVAEEEGAIFADWGAAPYADADMADDVHPGQAYSTRLVEQLVKALDAAAPECK